MKYKEEIFSSFLGAAMFIADYVAEGWKINKDDLPHQPGFGYYVSLVHEGDPVEKLTRHESLAKARAAIGTKKKEQE